MRIALAALVLASCTDFQFAEDLTCSDFGTCPPGQFCDPTGDVCRVDLPGCGNGELDADEVCDDGNRTTGDGCRADCQKAEVCGDGVQDPQEACDDGNTTGADGCAADCSLEGCGNNIVDDGEECDDGDANSPTGDCSTSCKLASCGDGNLHAGVEACDDGAANADTGACLTSCELATCGDGKVQAGVEACDDANDIDSDGCLESCETASCGDGHVQIGVELCEPNALDPQACNADCTTDRILQVAPGLDHTCVLRAGGFVRCWGEGGSGQLGYASIRDIGDNEPPALSGDIELGGVAVEVTSGDSHSCARLAGGAVRCWGAAANGRLGYGNTTNIGDDETPASAGNVAIGGTAVQLVAGGQHTCVLLATGAVRCWGRGANGRLGHGNVNDIGDDETPASAGDVTIGGAVVQLVAGDAHTCARLSTGKVRCWGNGADGRLGYGNTTTIGDDESPAAAGDVPLGAPAVALAAGDKHTCAILDTGAVRCWGAGADGRLGRKSTTTIGDDEPASQAGDVVLGGAAVAIAAGARHTCALLTNNNVRCWGAGLDGRLGTQATTTIGDDEDPTAVLPIKLSSAPTRIAAGPTHTCVIDTAGDVRCWGTGTGGRLGYGNTSNVGDDEAPADAGVVFAMGAVMQVAVGDFHACAIGDAGQVRCWGQGSDGQLGSPGQITIGDDELPKTAGDVDVGGFAIQLALGSAHSCALLRGGTVRCWGFGGDGRLGYANTATIGDDETPATAGDVDVGGTVKQIAAGSAHTCALLDTGKVRCWGAGSSGRLGYGNLEFIGDDETPASAGDVDVGGTVVQIAAGGDHTCALLDTKRVRCWGFGGNQFGGDGRLGYGVIATIGDDETPASAGDVDTGGDVLQIVAGQQHTCALLDNEAGNNLVRCWGFAGQGRLGYANTTTIGDNETPASAGPVALTGNPIQLSIGTSNTCALFATGAVRCWGAGFAGRNGNKNPNDIGDNEAPPSIDIVIGGPVTQLETGETHSCARLANGRVRCWGSNFLGNLGYGNKGSEHSIGDDEDPADAGDVAVF